MQLTPEIILAAVVAGSGGASTLVYFGIQIGRLVERVNGHDVRIERVEKQIDDWRTGEPIR